MFKINNRDTRKRCEICYKLTIKTTVNYEQAYVGWVNLQSLYPSNV